ncbi:MAG: hypothetical protein OEY37_11385 [Gammaproteobacteria bacterium]|nr:hypothetical protein [Gammaproteobacteria bacterium]
MVYRRELLQVIGCTPVLRGDNAVTSWAPSNLPDADDSTTARPLRDLIRA